MEVFLLEGESSRTPFYFEMAVPNLTRISTTVNTWVVNDLQ